MKRDYDSGEKDAVEYFYGVEVEHTPAFGKHTLFIVGLHSVDDIAAHIYSPCEHIFFGANHSFAPMTAKAWEEWENMISYFLDLGYLCSLDIPISHVESFHEGNLCSYNNFIPQIRVPIPYTKLWNYNTTIKIDDKDFKATNPGVWSHSLHDLMAKDKFTSWDKYGNDKVIK